MASNVTDIHVYVPFVFVFILPQASLLHSETPTA